MNQSASWWVLFAGTLLVANAASAGTIGYWRMEADIDATANLQVANEVAGNDLTATTAFIDSNLPSTSVPLTGAPNVGSLGSTNGSFTGAGINGSVAAYAALNVPSITVEFWARTVESDAELFLRSTGSNGIIIDQPSDLRVQWWVEDGIGGAELRQMTNLFDMDASWNHFAFAYDHLTGQAEFFVDGTSVGTDNGIANRALVWDDLAPVELGVRMDFSSALNGTLDEVRIDDNALVEEDLLIPEPGTAGLVLWGLLGLATQRRRR